MTKKHFEAAARYVREVRARGLSEHTCRAIENAFVDVCFQFNPRFDVDRFRAACRGTDKATTVATRTVRA